MNITSNKTITRVTPPTFKNLEAVSIEKAVPNSASPKGLSAKDVLQAMESFQSSMDSGKVSLAHPYPEGLSPEKIKTLQLEVTKLANRAEESYDSKRDADSTPDLSAADLSQILKETSASNQIEAANVKGQQRGVLTTFSTLLAASMLGAGAYGLFSGAAPALLQDAAGMLLVTGAGQVGMTAMGVAGVGLFEDNDKPYSKTTQFYRENSEFLDSAGYVWDGWREVLANSKNS